MFMLDLQSITPLISFKTQYYWNQLNPKIFYYDSRFILKSFFDCNIENPLVLANPSHKTK